MQVITIKPTINKIQGIRQHRKPFELPVRAEGEQLYDYVMGIKPESEVEYLTIGGMNFEKRVLPNCASFISEQEKYHEPRLIARPFTEKQAKAILERAEELEIEVPAIQNLKYNGNGNSDEPEYLPAKFVKASDIIVFCKVNEYNPIQIQSQSQNREELLEQSPAPIKDALGVKEEMYKAQNKQDVKGKK